MNKKALLGIAVALVLPLSFYVIAKVLGKDRLPMPRYYNGADTVTATEGKKLISAGMLKPVGDLEAINQFGDRVSLARDLKGRMLAINFFFTTCTGPCPKLTSNIRLLEYAFRRTPMRQNDTTVQFVSISVDPGNDSAAALRAYAKQNSVDQNHWWFLTGDKKTIYNWARSQLNLSVPAGDGGADDWIHTTGIIVLDRNHFIRGFYDGLDTASVGRCANDLGLLAMEKR